MRHLPAMLLPIIPLATAFILAFGVGPTGTTVVHAQTPVRDAADPPARVGRMARLLGTVSFHTAEQTDWSAATLNYPITSGNAFWTQPSSAAEIDVGRTHIALDQSTEFNVDVLDDRTMQATAAQGAVFLRIRDLPDGNSYRITTPRGVAVITRAGAYEIAAGDADRPTTVTVLEGAARIGSTAGGGNLGAVPGWALALRSAVGGGRGERDSWNRDRRDRNNRGSVGLIPLGPQEACVPPYRTSDRYDHAVNSNNVTTNTNVTNVTNVTMVTNYVNSGAATLVPAGSDDNVPADRGAGAAGQCAGTGRRSGRTRRSGPADRRDRRGDPGRGPTAEYRPRAGRRASGSLGGSGSGRCFTGRGSLARAAAPDTGRARPQGCWRNRCRRDCSSGRCAGPRRARSSGRSSGQTRG